MLHRKSRTIKYPSGISFLTHAISFVALACTSAQAQVPSLPPVDLGLTNMSDGLAGQPGFYYVSYLQIFQTNHINDQNGKPVNTNNNLKINSLATIHLATYLSNWKVFGSNLGFLLGFQVDKISSTASSGMPPSVNPDGLGDLVVGSSVQWAKRILFRKDFSHRIEVDVSFPTGSYDPKYAINVSAHLYTCSFYHAFTYVLSNRFAVSARNTFNYNSAILGTEDKPGAFYNGNYAFELGLVKTLRLELAAYYLAQFNQDTHDGSSAYYFDHFGIYNTKERLLGYGPGVSYVTHGGVFIEGKVFFEHFGRNIPSGIRPTVRLVIPIAN